LEDHIAGLFEGSADVFNRDGGETRVPVHLIATLVAESSDEEELRAGHPRLTAEMIRLAPAYAMAYPLRGRLRKQPWHDQPPKHVSLRPVAAITVV
jgi:hypothetical protein